MLQDHGLHRRYFTLLGRLAAAALAAGLLASCAPHRFFYYPNRVEYADPARQGISYTVLRYPSLNGRELTALLFESDGPPAGVIVHFHGNFGNLTNHLGQSYFLTKHGFDVLIFDYQGYGGSEGTPSPRRSVEDGIATVRLARNLPRNPSGRVGIFGQSLGGAVGLVVAAKETWVAGIVAEAAFSSYRSMARHATGRSVWLWPMYPVYPLFLSTRWDAERFVRGISPRPVLFIHGEADRTVPAWMSRRLYERAKEPRELWEVPGAGHLGIRQAAGTDYKERLAGFFRNVLADKK